MKPKAVIFDLDGTLADTSGDLLAAAYDPAVPAEDLVDAWEVFRTAS